MKDFNPSPLALAALAVAAIMLFSGLGTLPLMQPDEGRNSEVAREMAVSRSWLVPTLEGHPYLDKPAAYFAAVAVSLRLFGVNEWGARLPSATCGLLILVMLYTFSRRYYDEVTAALVVIVVSTSPLVFAFSRIVIMDIALAVCTVAAILAAFVAEETDPASRQWHAAAAAAVGLGMLVKGPVGLLVPATVLAVFFWIDGRKQALRRVFSPWNALIVFGLFLPWFFALCRAHPEFLHYGLVDETFNRFFTKAFNRGQPFWFFGPVMLGGLLPWTVLFVPMVAAAVSMRSRLTRADRLFIVWAVVVMVFFSLSRTKQPGYVLSGAIASAVCVGRGLGYAWRNSGGRAARLVARASLALCSLALAVALALGYAVARGAAAVDRLAAMTPYRRSFWELWPFLLGALAVVVVLAAIAFARRRAGFAVAAFAIVPLMLVTVALPAIQGLARARSAKPLAERLAAFPASTEIACLNGYPAGLSFYLGRTLTMLSEDGMPLRSNFVLYWLRQLETRPATVVAPSEREVWLASRHTDAFILAPESARAELERFLGARATVREMDSGWWGAPVLLPEGR